MLSSFKKCYVYESYFASGSDNTLNPDNYDGFDRLTDDRGNFLDIMTKWDEYILKDCIDTCNGLLGKSDEVLKPIGEHSHSLTEKQVEQYNRNYKCYTQVSKNKGKQFVLADVGLALCIDKSVWTPVKVAFNDAGYTQFIEDSTSNVYTVMSLGVDKLKEGLRELYH
jgi:hypothetical protein